jgi:hypothetical protein
MSNDIIIPLHKNPITHKLSLDTKIDFIRNIRNVANCDLRAAKDAAEAIEKIILNLVPTINTTRNRIAQVMREHEENTPENLQFMLDVLRFMETTKPSNLKAHNIPVGTFKDNGDYNAYNPVKEKSMYHDCGDACLHKCEHAGCDRMVQYHDEPYCFTHSPDEGSSVAGYDSRNNNPF